jgi:hypothetical protein
MMPGLGTIIFQFKEETLVIHYTIPMKAIYRETNRVYKDSL